MGRGVSIMIYAIIDPRDGEEISYRDNREAAKQQAEFLEQSSAHSYRAYNVRLIVRKVKP
jgi:hypothetical protein